MEEELSRLPKELTPSDVLRTRTIAALRDANLIAPRRHRWMLTAAALLAGLAIGWFAPHPQPAMTHGREFMLFVHDTPSMATDGKEPQRVVEYSNWARSLRARGILEGGEKLTEEVSAVGTNASTSDVGGFFRIVARDRAEAVAIAQTCPHVKHGGWIEVREIDRI